MHKSAYFHQSTVIFPVSSVNFSPFFISDHSWVKYFLAHSYVAALILQSDRVCKLYQRSLTLLSSREGN